MEDDIDVRALLPGDAGSVRALMSAQIEDDTVWPPTYARDGDLDAWLADRAALGRWVAVRNGSVIAHVGADLVAPGPKAEVWTAELDCARDRLAEIGRLVVHPEARRLGVSERVTRRCVRDIVSAGHVPVASALEASRASIAMMTKLGWRIVGEVQGRRSGATIVLLVAPRKLLDAARSAPA